VIVWDFRRGQPRATFQSHRRIAGVALSPDARTAYSASLDGSVTVWDVAGSRRLGRLFAATSQFKVGTTISESGAAPRNGVAYNFATTLDGTTLAVLQPDGFVNLIDARTLRLRGRIRATTGVLPVGVAFAPDGRTLAITDDDAQLRFWDARTRKPLSRAFHGADPRVTWWGPRFSRDGRWLVTDGNDAVVRLWDARRHVPVRKLQLPELPGDMALRPDGRVLVVPSSWGPGRGSVEILAMPSLKRVARISIKYARIARFSSDGRLLIIGDNDGRAQLYDGRTFRPLGRPLVGHAGYVLTADFSPDGRTVATSSADGTVRLWDTGSTRLIGTPLPGVPNVEVGVAFIRGGTHIAAAYDSGQGYAWDVRPSSWARYACAVAGRELTRTEWDEALPGRQYAPACTTR
jgi:WD40 repeat protein